MSKKRMQSLAKLLGTKKAEDVRGDLQKQKHLLDLVGVERKAVGVKQEDVLVIADAVATAILDKLDAAGVLEAAAGSEDASEISKPEDVTEIVAEAAMEAVEAVENDEVEEEERAEDEEEEDEEDVSEKALSAVNKQLGDALASALKDMGDVAEGQVEIVEVVKELAPFIKGLNDRLSAIEKTVKSRPRQASQADETVFENEEVEKRSKESLNGTTTFLGISVKDDAEE